MLGTGWDERKQHVPSNVLVMRRQDEPLEKAINNSGLHRVTLRTRPLTCSYLLSLEGAFSCSLNLKLSLMASEFNNCPYSFCQLNN